MIPNIQSVQKDFFYMRKILLFFATISFVGTQYAQQPNIVVIFSDDHTQQTISAYRSKLMQTPHIDRIAKEGALFNNVFVTNSICAPSRAVLLTGKYSHINGLKDNGPHRFFDPLQQQIQKILTQKKYQTAWIGKWHLQSLPNGFDYWKILPDQGNYFQPDFINMSKDTTREKGYVTDLISDYALEWLKNRKAAQPFFLVVGEKATHRNWMPDPKDFAEFENQEFPLPENFFDTYDKRQAAAEQDMTISKTMLLQDDLKIGVDYTKRGMFGRMTDDQKTAYKAYYNRAQLSYDKIKHDSIEVMKWKYQRYLRDYLATARSMDRNIGRILDYLDATGLSKNTLVVYTSDQGFYMGEHGWFDKRFMYEESLRTPFMMRYPGKIQPGTQINEMVVNIDVAPTLLDYAGIDVPKDMQGMSFKSLLENNTATQKKWRKAMYYHYYEYPEPHRVSPHLGMRTDRYKLILFYAINKWELFDLQIDPKEMHNIIDDLSQKNRILQLKKQLKELAEYYKDREAIDILSKQ